MSLFICILISRHGRDVWSDLLYFLISPSSVLLLHVFFVGNPEGEEIGDIEDAVAILLPETRKLDEHLVG